MISSNLTVKTTSWFSSSASREFSPGQIPDTGAAHAFDQPLPEFERPFVECGFAIIGCI